MKTTRADCSSVNAHGRLAEIYLLSIGFVFIITLTLCRNNATTMQLCWFFCYFSFGRTQMRCFAETKQRRSGDMIAFRRKPVHTDYAFTLFNGMTIIPLISPQNPNAINAHLEYQNVCKTKSIYCVISRTECGKNPFECQNFSPQCGKAISRRIEPVYSYC